MPSLNPFLVTSHTSPRLRASPQDVPLRSTLGAALVYGICFYLHQTHALLGAVYVLSNVAAPLEQPLLEE
jgi:hypothetical protein